MTKPITCIITDDEPFARKGLQAYIEKTNFLQLNGVCEDALELGRMLNRQPADLLFLDIQMPHISGVEFLRSLANPPKVIFTTAFKEYAIDGFELDVLDYMLKPIPYDRFLKGAYKAKDYFDLKANTEPATYLFVKAGGRLEKVVFEDVLYIEGMENYVIIHTAEKRIITHTTLKSILEKLPGQQFMQTHKSYLVAINKVVAVAGNMLHVGSAQVPIGRQFRETVLGKLI